MKKKKNAMITIDVTLGIVFSITLFIAVVWIVVGLVRPTEESKNSFYNLVNLIEKVDGSNPGTIKSMALRMDKNTAIIGFPKNKESIVSSGEIDTGEYGIYKVDNIFNKPPDCKKDKTCICLCRKPERQEDRNFICEDENLICETFDGLNFIGDGFIISRSKMPGFTIKSDLISTEDMSQFREVYVEKYSGYGDDLVAVCENLEKGSCVSQEYREENKAIYGLKKLQEFIESCKEREFVKDEEPCSCGSFDFMSEIPEKYIVEFKESDEGNLKLILTHEDKGDEIISSTEVDMPLCIFHPILKVLDYPEDGSTIEDSPLLYNYYLGLGKDKGIILEYNLPEYYTHYYKEDTEDNRIVFIKENNENICILKYSERGYIGLDAESPDTITFKPVSKIVRRQELGHSEINITGCGDSATDEE